MDDEETWDERKVPFTEEEESILPEWVNSFVDRLPSRREIELCDKGHLIRANLRNGDGSYGCRCGAQFVLKGDDLPVAAPVTEDTSDGYHTFRELYAHRIELWLTLCNALSHTVWRSRMHSDGTGIPGWFVLGMGRDPGRQITYHLPDDKWGECEWAETLDKAPPFDGHSSADVLARLAALR